MIIEDNERKKKSKACLQRNRDRMAKLILRKSEENGEEAKNNYDIEKLGDRDDKHLKENSKISEQCQRTEQLQEIVKSKNYIKRINEHFNDILQAETDEHNLDLNLLD